MAARILVVGGDADGRAALVARVRAAGHIVVEPPEEPVRGEPEPEPGPELALALAPEASVEGLRTVALVVDGPDLAARLERALAAGAEAALPLSLDDAALAREIERHLGALAVQRRLATGRRCAFMLQEVEQLIAADASLPEILAVAAPVFADSAIVVFDGDPPWIAADRAEASDRGSLDGVPEARAVLATGETVLSPSATAFPIEWHGRTVGALVFRKKRIALDEVLLRMGRVLAGLLAPLSEGARAVPVPEHAELTQPLIGRREDERRLRAIEKFRGYFEAAADSVVVLDGAGHVLFVNRAAEELTGFAREALVGRPLADIVPDDWRARLAPLIGGVVGGRNLEGFDLPIHTTSGALLWVSVATSTVLSEHGAAILSFRDVTSERQLEAELRKTKEFLERLIDSTVDGILAADTAGTVILYNPGAERIFAWPPDQVIGRMDIARLYPDGVARQIMRMLRSPSYGGVGRLELTRREVLTRTGDIVPVNMTASVLYEDGKEVATVWLLSDLRERIRIEQRLLMAQEKLLVTEKQAVIAELAGAAAHELNQPLTSVTLYVEMMLRRMPPDDVNQRAVHAIGREVGRMAEIVKKIGRITRYETKQYVGGASILDLEKSSDAAAPPGEPGGETPR